MKLTTARSEVVTRKRAAPNFFHVFTDDTNTHEQQTSHPPHPHNVDAHHVVLVAVRRRSAASQTFLRTNIISLVFIIITIIGSLQHFLYQRLCSTVCHQINIQSLFSSI